MRERSNLASAWMLAFFILSSFVAACAQPHEPIVRFRDAVAAELKQRAPTACIRALDEMTLNFGPAADDCANRIAVENQYRAVSNGANRTEAINALVVVALPLLSTEPRGKLDLTQLVVMLRPQGYGLLADVPSAKVDYVSRPFAGDMIAILMLKRGDTVRGVNQQDLNDVNVTEGQAFALAATNLRRLMGKVDTGDIRGLDLVVAESGLVTGLLWLQETCVAGMRTKFVLVVDRDSYLITDVIDRRSAAAFIEAADALISNGQSVSKVALACHAGQWTVARDVRFPN